MTLEEIIAEGQQRMKILKEDVSNVEYFNLYSDQSTKKLVRSEGELHKLKRHNGTLETETIKAKTDVQLQIDSILTR